jgi:hypothetical protein
MPIFLFSFHTKHLHFIYPMPWQAISATSIQDSAFPIERLFHTIIFGGRSVRTVEECFFKGTQS